jgi:hypothetical protein
MDRVIIYPGAIPLETDLLNTNRNVLVGLSKIAAAVLGTSTLVNGLACAPTSPASLQVQVAPGEIYSLQNLDGTAYSSLAADTTHQILKQGLLMDTVTLNCPAPSTSGYSINYLIEATYQDVDGNALVLPYYNASNPSQAYSGPNNTGSQNYTTRKGVCAVSVKAGVAATTGSQTTPAPDAGYTGAYVVTVTYGQTQILAGNISTYASAPFLPSAGLVVGGLQGNACNISAAGGTADAITGSYTPGISALTNGMTLYVRAGSANATTTPTFTPASGTISAKTIVKGAGSALAAGDIAGGGHWIELQYDATLDKWVLLNPATGISPASGASVQGAFKNLQASATGLSANVSVTADEIAVENAANAYQTLRTVNLTIAGTSSGVANGLDTGALAASTWYSVWIIWNGTTTAGLLSLSATTPTMPSGYTHKARVGWIRTDGTANKYPLSFIQYGRDVQYKLAAGSNVTVMPQMASGSATFWTAIGCSPFVPPTASRIRGFCFQPSSNATAQVQVAPNSSWNTGGINSSSGGFGSFGVASNGNYGSYPFEMAIESANIYWGSTGAGNSVQCLGWEDNF